MPVAYLIEFSSSSDAIMDVKLNFLSLIVFVLLKQKVIVAASADISCKDNNGNFVDW